MSPFEALVGGMELVANMAVVAAAEVEAQPWMVGSIVEVHTIVAAL